MKFKTKNIIIGIFIGILATLLISHMFRTNLTQTQSQRQIADYYANSVATLKSPHSLRKEMNRGYHDYIVVDTRAQSDYENGHITGALNIDSEQSVEEVVDAFTELSVSSDKQIVIYCYSASCMNGRKVGNVLAQNGIFVKELTIGYNEWEFFPDSWNYPDEKGTYDIEDYITRGTNPGTPIVNLEALSSGCGVEGELSC